MIEEWKDIEGYEGLYQVSNLGNVRSLDRTVIYSDGSECFYKGKILKQNKDIGGYLRISFNKFGKKKIYFTHRLVAEAFIPNTDNKPSIDHINTNRTDNRVENLRWCTQKENCNNPLTIKKMSVNNGKPSLGKFSKEHNSSKPILQFDLNGNFIRKWDCAKDVERELGFNRGHISSCCKKMYGFKTANGYIWRYAIKFNVFDLAIEKVV